MIASGESCVPNCTKGYYTIISKNYAFRPLTDVSFAAAIESCLQEDPVFGRCYTYGYTYEGDAFGTLPEWDVSRVTNMMEAFYKKDGLGGNLYGNFNGNLKIGMCPP